jgi:cytochrome c biogenesis protein CcmG/thiol:disulfide interchange protein DsbE
MKHLRYLVPLAVFGVLAVFLWMGLDEERIAKISDVPSPLINKPAPDFRLPQLHQPELTFARKDMLGKVWLLNVWASWCVSCRQEHPVLMQLARTGEVPIYGLNYKDTRDEAERWLRQFGDPYTLSAQDVDGNVGIDFGVYGVPETFVIDRQGVVRHKHIGPVTPESLQKEILPLVRKL